jgi:hypothetical protein
VPFRGASLLVAEIQVEVHLESGLGGHPGGEGFERRLDPQLIERCGPEIRDQRSQVRDASRDQLE